MPTRSLSVTKTLLKHVFWVDRAGLVNTRPNQISNLKLDIRFEIGYPIRLGIYQACPVNPKDVFEESFSDTQTSGSRLTMLF